jgi:hypothetical protein
VAAVLLGFAGGDALRDDAQAHPPRRPWGAPGQGMSGKRHAIIGAEARGQPACCEHARAHGVGRRDARRGPVGHG